MRREDVLILAGHSRIVAILRGELNGREIEIAEALAAGGVSALEVSIVSPNYAAAITNLARHMGNRIAIGAGTVLSVEQLREVAGCGASFIVSPNFDPEVVEETRTMGLASFPGAYTATEIVAAWRAGADAVKVFPSNGPEYIRALKAPLPQIRLVPTGGVTAANIGEFVAAGGWAFGIASELVSAKEIPSIDAATLTARAQSFTDALKESQQESQHA